MNKKINKSICYLSVVVMMLCNNAFGASTATFMEHYNAAQGFLEQNQYSSAIVEFRKAMFINYLDNSARIGLINSYLARATHYANTEKNYAKAANDFRSALFYMKIYPQNEQDIQNSSAMIASAVSNLNQCLKVSSFDSTSANRYKVAEQLRATADWAAAAYEFSKAAENEKYTSDSYTQIADILKILRNEPQSAIYYRKALELNPNDSVLRMKYARTLERTGNYDEAITQYNEALSNSKGDKEILFALDNLYYNKLAITPRDAELNANMGAIKQAQGDYESALSYYGKAEQLNPDNITTRINVGTLFQEKKDYNKAIEAYDSVLTLYPNNIHALSYKAQALSEMGNKKEALELYKKVLTLEPENQSAKVAVYDLIKETMSPSEYVTYLAKNGTAAELYDFAYKMHKDNKIDDAINAYKTVIVKDASKSDAYVNLAICYASKDEYTNAISILNDAKNKFPTNNLVIKTLQEVQSDFDSSKFASASSSYENKDYQKAIQEYLAINPATESSLLGIAASYQALDDYENAIVYYKKAEVKNPKNSEIPYYIGYLYSEQKKWQEAENYLKKAVSMNPESEAKNLLTYVSQSDSVDMLNQGIELFNKQNFAEALTKLNDVIKKDSKNAYAYYYRGLIYDEQKQPKSAIPDYINALKNTQEIPIINYMLAVDYDTTENYKEAYKYFGEFINKYTTEDEYLNYAKSRMEELKPYAG